MLDIKPCTQRSAQLMGMPGTNRLAYFVAESVTWKNYFVTLTVGHRFRGVQHPKVRPQRHGVVHQPGGLSQGKLLILAWNPKSKNVPCFFIFSMCSFVKPYYNA